MDDALPFFVMAALGCSLALVIWIAGRVWLRGKELERTTPSSLNAIGTAELGEILTRIESRLGQLEQWWMSRRSRWSGSLKPSGSRTPISATASPA